MLENRNQILITFIVLTHCATDPRSNRGVLHNKILKRPHVTEARVNRGEPVKGQFGPGFPEEQAMDEWDHKGLQGNEVVRVTQDDKGARVVTVITPFRATHNTRGVDCLQCHTVPSGAVNGAIRISYSMAAIDATTQQAMWYSTAVKAALFIVGLILISVILGKVVMKPLNEMKERVRDIAEGQGDLTKQLDESVPDEMGELAHWFNTFVAKLRGIIVEITNVTSQLAASADLSTTRTR